MRKKLILLFTIMFILSAIGAVTIKLTSPRINTMLIQTDKKINIVTTIYPVYLIGLNIANENSDIEVSSIINGNTGCLHDYQLTTKDMKLIASADILVINGGGMEGFLEDITANYPDLTIIDASQGITMLPSGGDELSLTPQDGETPEHDEVPEDGEAHDYGEAQEDEVVHEDLVAHNHDEGEYNPHVWLNPKLYVKQIENVRDGLIQYINTSYSVSKTYISRLTNILEQNSTNYINKINILDADMEDFTKTLTQDIDLSKKNRQSVIFHDSFAYLADRVGLKIAFSVPLESDTALSAGDIAEIVDDVKTKDIKYLFTEQQYSDSIAKQIAEETSAKVYIIDSAVTGDGTKDSYLQAMENNLKTLKKAIKE